MPKDFDQLATPLLVNDKDWGNPIVDDVHIDQGNLDQEFLNQAEKYAWWAFLTEHAKAQANELKSELDVLYARLDHLVRAKAQIAAVDAKNQKVTPVKYTEKMVENEVVTSKDYQELMTRYNQARKDAGLATAGMMAMNQRRDMLLQLGANYRTEGQADPIILKEAAREKAAVYAREREQRKAERDAKLQEARQAHKAANDEFRKPPIRRPLGKPTV